MPAAHLMTQQIGALSPLMQQQSSLQNGLVNGLAQYQGNSLDWMLGQQNSFAQQPETSEERKARTMVQARWAADEGDKLIGRMAFWSAFGMFAAPIMNRLADKLDRVTDRVERHTAAAA